MNKRHIIVFVTAFILISGCKEVTTDDGETVICTTSIEPAISLSIFDQQTGIPIACGAVATLQDGDFTEQLEHSSSNTCSDSTKLSGAYEREGTYDIYVTKDGYQDCSTSGVVVTANVCHVNTIPLQVYLESN